jgi:uncharacterized membrane protein (DUF485 family)
MLTEDLYRILQVDPRAEPEVIEAAYRRLARKYHPDVNRSADSAERMKELNAAYEVLRHPAYRAAYDGQRSPTCQHHPDRAGALICDGCGAGLCESCAARFQPPTCVGCVLRWARRRQISAIVVRLAVAMVVVVVAGLSVWTAAYLPGFLSVQLGGAHVALPAVAAVASTLVIAALVGRALRDLDQLRAVVSEALAAA